MTVYELIVALKAFNPDTKVTIDDMFYGLEEVTRVVLDTQIDPFTFTKEEKVKIS